MVLVFIAGEDSKITFFNRKGNLAILIRSVAVEKLPAGRKALLIRSVKSAFALLSEKVV